MRNFGSGSEYLESESGSASHWAWWSDPTRPVRTTDPDPDPGITLQTGSKCPKSIVWLNPGSSSYNNKNGSGYAKYKYLDPDPKLSDPVSSDRWEPRSDLKCYSYFTEKCRLHTAGIRRPFQLSLCWYWVPQQLPKIYAVIAYICIGKVAWFAIYNCGYIWNMYYHCRKIR